MPAQSSLPVIRDVLPAGYKHYGQPAEPVEHWVFEVIAKGLPFREARRVQESREIPLFTEF